MECPRVWKLLKSFRKGDGEPTISYRCSALKHDIWLWWPFAFFSTWIDVHLERKLFKSRLWFQKTEEWMTGPTWRSRDPKFCETGANWAKFPLCVAHFSLCVTLLWGLFWGTCRCPKCAQVGLLESLACLLSNPTGISQFGAHWPFQILILPILLFMCPKSCREAIFGCFLTSRRPKTYQNFFPGHQ